MIDIFKVLTKVNAKRMKKLKSKDTLVSASEVKEYWQILLSDSYYKSTPQFSFTKGESKILKNILDLFNTSGIDIRDFLNFAIENWNLLRRKITWDGSRNSRLPKTPTFKSIYYAKEDILIVMYAERTNAKTGKKKQTKKKDKKKKVYTSISKVPLNHPHRDGIIALLRATGRAEIYE